jgi:hypothetical protein
MSSDMFPICWEICPGQIGSLKRTHEIVSSCVNHRVFTVTLALLFAAYCNGASKYDQGAHR